MKESLTSTGLLFLLWGCADPEADLGEADWALAGGIPDSSHPATVLLRLADRACSGSLIGPRTVVAAKHCMDLGSNGATVFAGAGGGGERRSVVAVLTTPGDEIRGQDIAVLTLDADLEVNPYPIRRDSSDLELDSTLVLVGYGRRPSGRTGARYAAESTLRSVHTRELDLQGEAAACHGDSGGTVLDHDGRLVGVISWGVGDGCSAESLTVATRVDAHLAIIRDTLGLGAPCERDEDCRDAECLPPGTGEGAVCTRRCDGLDPLAGCPAGSYCDRHGRVGVCRLGWPGRGQFWSPCALDTDCASLLCWKETCRDACDADLDCGIGMRCERTESTSTGACFAGSAAEDGPADAARPEVTPSADVGAPCDDNGDCATGLCGHWPDGPVCTARCDGDTACPEGFACVAVESERLCAPPARERSASGCSIESRRPRLGPLLSVVLAAGVLFTVVRRRPRGSIDRRR